MKNVYRIQMGFQTSRFSILIVVILLSYLNSNCQTIKKYDSKDLQALNEIPVKWERYWNIHNMDSMGTLLREEVDLAMGANPFTAINSNSYFRRLKFYHINKCQT